MKVRSRSNKPYTARDMQVMRECARAKLPSRIAAKRLGRSPAAVRFKACMAGVSFKSINRHAA